MNVIKASAMVCHYTFIMNLVSKFASAYSTMYNASLDGDVNVGDCHGKLSLNLENAISSLMKKCYIALRSQEGKDTDDCLQYCCGIKVMVRLHIFRHFNFQTKGCKVLKPRAKRKNIQVLDLEINHVFSFLWLGR